MTGSAETRSAAAESAAADPGVAGSPPARPSVTWRRAMVAATLATLGRGRWWLVALATFLVRGGLLLLLPPLVMLPTTAELAGLLGPSIVGTGFATPTTALVTLVAVTTLALAAAILATAAIGAWLEAALVEDEAADPEIVPRDVPARPSSTRLSSAIGVRLLAHLPTAIAIVVAVLALEGAITDELTSPGGTGPLALRVAARVPGPLVAVVGLWLLGEAWGGIALRRLAVDRSVAAALERGLVDLVRPSGLATLVLGTAVAGLPVVAVWLPSGRAFERLWPLVVDGSDPVLVVIALGLLVGAWLAGLWLLAIGLAWRSAAWTAEVLRHT